MAAVARKRKIRLPADTAIDAEVDLNLIVADGTYFLRARLNVSLPGVDRNLAQAIVNEADRICPYSRATRGNIDVAINLAT
jgi:osmotically inducible protein OsmC